MDLKQIRDQLLQQKAVHDKELEMAKASCEELKQIVASIKPEELDAADNYNISLTDIMNIDYALLETSASYREQKLNEVDALLEQLSTKIEECLHVPC